MFRKLLSAITSTAVVAGLVTAGAVAGTVATAAPAAAVTGGSLVVTKTFDPKTSGASSSFTIDYSCTNGGPSGTTTVTAGGQATIPVASNAGNTTCTVVEPSPTSPAGWGFFLPVFSGSNQQSDTPFEGEVTFTQNNQTRTLNLANQIDAVPLSTTGSGSNGVTVQTSANPVIPNSCGIDTTLVLDASGSISNAGAVQDVRDASNALLNTLKDTKSTARILQFSNNSQQLAART